MRLARFTAVLCLIAATAFPALAGQDAVQRVTALGRAYQSSEADRDSARRRAIIDALANAVLSGGAQLRGHTAMVNGRITSDLSILRPTGRVLSHQVIEEKFQNGIWFVSVLADVGSTPIGGCAARRQIVLSAEPPTFRAGRMAPAWAEQIGRSALNDVVRQIADHPGFDLSRFVDATQPRNAAMNYAALTQGTSVSAPGDHRLQSKGLVTMDGSNTVTITVELAFTGPDGIVARRDFSISTRTPKGGVLDVLSGIGRAKAERQLATGLAAQVEDYLDLLTCEAPSARVEMRGDQLSVPIGRRHGLTRASLAIIDDPDSGFGLLELKSLSRGQAVLKPIDPNRRPDSVAGKRVYFLDAGL